ncbi:PAS domain-containing protein [Aquicoccus sp. SCR17]|nr:PAS domain-containing protein [Carideicomes alvinocaridis]
MADNDHGHDAAPAAARYIVGIGSSAGGLEALRGVASALPPDLSAAYVVAQHMSPQHKSLLTALVGRESALEVADVTDGLTPEPGKIYVTPPNTDVVMEEDRLRLVPPATRRASPKPSIDRFLLSLAEARGDCCVAVILSGTGSDGAYGVQAVREAGGISIAQEDSSAKYDGMPRAAVETGCVDLILTPREIGAHLARMLSGPDGEGRGPETEEADAPPIDLLQILLAQTRVDFREYKQTTVQRRIERRMTALGITDQAEYVRHCRDSPEEVEILFRDLLISVTRFFRDPREFDHLRDALAETLPRDRIDPIRVWVAGCATGEEAYSVAILLAELMGGPEALSRDRLQIFATDIDEAALQTGRSGQYPEAALDDIPPDYAERYFYRVGDRIHAIDALRSVILFSNHNICNDPPFQRLDLICCRNLMIYFGAALQNRILARLNYALREGGLLFLGTAESTFGSEDLFVPVGRHQRIFRKRVLGSRVGRTPLPAVARSLPGLGGRRQRGNQGKPNTERLLFDALAKSVASDALLISDGLDILRVYGDVSPYIQLREGVEPQIRLNLLRSPMREEARNLIALAFKHRERRAGVKHLLAQTESDAVQLEAIPIISDQLEERVLLLTFRHVPKPDSLQPADTAETPKDEPDGARSQRIAELERELSSTREALQQTIEEVESSNEELQSLNEELQSTNEELQATNEELETANEELQSTNEELITVNEEMQVNAAQLSAKTRELTSLLEHAPSALLMVNEALLLAEASRQARTLFQLPEHFAGQTLGLCRLPEGFPELAPICDEALRADRVISREFISHRARYRLDCAPFSDRKGQVRGVTLAISEFPELARTMEMILDHAPLHFIWRDAEGRILRISEMAAAALGGTRTELEGQSYYADPATAETLRQADRHLLARSLDSETESGGLARSRQLSAKWLSLEQFVHRELMNGERTIYTIGTDVTPMIEASRAQLRGVEGPDGMRTPDPIGFWEYHTEDGRLYWSNEVHQLYGTDPETYRPSLDEAIRHLHPEDHEKTRQAMSEALATGRGFVLLNRIIRTDGEVVWVEARGEAPVSDGRASSCLFGSVQRVEGPREARGPGD